MPLRRSDHFLTRTLASRSWRKLMQTLRAQRGTNVIRNTWQARLVFDGNANEVLTRTIGAQRSERRDYFGLFVNEDSPNAGYFACAHLVGKVEDIAHAAASFSASPESRHRYPGLAA